MTEYMKKEEITHKLKTLGEAHEELQGLSREELLKKLEEKQAALAQGQLLTATPIVEKTEAVLGDIVPIKPLFGSRQWSDFVMSQFTEKTELINGMPTCDGLRRVFQLLIGPITDTHINVIKAPHADDPTATVICEITYEDCRNIRSNPYPNEPIRGSIADAFDVSPENTPFPWNTAAVATASTKAEARALRKGLGLIKVLSQEEVTQGFEAVAESKTTEINSDSTKLGGAAKVMMRALASKTSIDLDKMFKELNITESVDNMTQEVGNRVMQLLQEYMRKPTTIPATIKAELSLPI